MKSEPVDRYIPRYHGDWPEDFSHENGNYMCQCCICKATFVGHKRRVICKLCDKGDIELVKGTEPYPCNT